MISVKVDGLAALEARLAKLGPAATTALASALNQEAELIMDQSKKLVPVDLGNLRSTGHVQLPVIEGPKVAVTMGYGGPAGPGEALRGGKSKHGGERAAPDAVGYAFYVHENLSAHHTTGQAKFLEQPANEAKSGMAGRLAQRIRPELGAT